MFCTENFLPKIMGVETYSCIKIDYFSEKGYQPDPHDSASAIPYTVTKSCPFFLASGIVLLLSFIVFLIPTCSHQNNLYYFSAGIMFIVSGLLMLIGLIAYISILKAEIGSKLRPRSTLQPPLFKVTYGQSFFLFVFGFIATEFVGLLNIFLYISLQEVGYYSHLPCLTITNLQEKIKEGENRYNSHTYRSYKHEVESKKPLERARRQQNKKHQVTVEELELDTQKLLKTMTQSNGKRSAGRVFDAVTDANAGPYACRKHPNGLSSTLFLNEMDRRYYFENPSTSLTRSKCNLHSRNLAKSLNELYTESTSSSALLPPPPPPSGIQLQTQTLPRPPQQFSDSPQEFPLTRSVSTTTDIYATQNVSFSGMPAARSAFASNNNNNNKNQRRNMATSTRYNTDTETQTSGNSRSSTNAGNTNTKALLQRNNNGTHSKKNLSQQLQQQPQQHANLYRKTNFTATTCTKNNDLLDTRLRRGSVNHHRIDGNNDGNNDNDNNVDDNDDAEDDEEEQPQTFCGLKRTIRKTKDELFEEFCKRAGVRPKPKNIYYIDNHEGEDDSFAGDDSAAQQFAEVEEEMQSQPLRLNNVRIGTAQQRLTETQGKHLKQQQQQQAHTPDYGGIMEHNRIFNDDAFGDADMVEDVDADDNGFKKLTENEEHLYVIDNNIHLMPPAIRSGRRASMYVEPNHLRRLNSNLSLHAIYAPTAAGTGLQKSLYGLNTSGNEFGLLTTVQQHQPQPAHYTLHDNSYGGSQQRLHHDYHNQAMYQSRTLPRSFMKRGTDSQDSIATASATQLHNIYSASQQRLTSLMMQHQQQLQQQNRFLAMSREPELYSSRYGMDKSNEELNRHYIQQQPQSAYTQSNHLQQYQQQQQQQQQQPNGVSCGNYGTVAAVKQPPLVQWPAAIPSSPSNFSGSFRLYGAATNSATQNTPKNHALLTRSNSNSAAPTVNGTLSGSQGPNKFQRAYAFDEQRRASAVVAEAFDLDEIERERRRSHASLFTVNSNVVALASGTAGSGVGFIGNTINKNQEHYDIINGTAV